MPDAAGPGRPFRDVGGGDYPRATADDIRRTQAQTVKLNVDSRRLRSRLIERHRRLIQRHGDRRGGPLNNSQAPIGQFVDETGQPLLTSVEFLVRTADLAAGADDFHPVALRQRLTELLPPNAQPTEQPIPELDNRVTAISVSGLEVAELANVVSELQVAGFHASMNQIAPCGYVTKSEPDQTGAEPTARTVQHPGPPPAGLRRVTVAVVDTGLSDQVRTDRWLDGASVGQPDVDPLYEIADSTPGNGPRDVFDFCAGHGTFVSGVVRQVAPYADLVVRRALGADGIGSDVDVAIALLQAFDAGADVINLSLGTETPADVPPLATQVALEIIAEKLANDPDRDVVVVAAAGNNGNTRPVYPAAFSAQPSLGVRVVSVAALTPRLRPADFSSHGFWVTCSTRGASVLSTFVAGQESIEVDRTPDTWVLPDPWAIWTGTSFAAPQISAAIARRCQEEGESPGVALTWLLAQGVPLPGYGAALEILPG